MASIPTLFPIILCVLSVLCGFILLTAEPAESAKVQYRLSHWLYSSIPSASLALSAVYFIKRRALKDRKDFCKDYLLNFPLTLCVLSALRGFILLTAEPAEFAKDSGTAFSSALFPNSLRVLEPSAVLFY